jgi:hypothetical protein
MHDTKTRDIGFENADHKGACPYAKLMYFKLTMVMNEFDTPNRTDLAALEEFHSSNEILIAIDRYQCLTGVDRFHD